jgi:hypothetical protein
MNKVSRPGCGVERYRAAPPFKPMWQGCQVAEPSTDRRKRLYCRTKKQGKSNPWRDRVGTRLDLLVNAQADAP